VLTANDEITLEDLPDSIKTARRISSGLSSFDGLSLKKAVSQFEDHLISDALKKFGSARRAARELQIEPSTLTRKIRRHGTISE
jgi:transcriptional regulator with PAS, ATPase and Fis domain